jgi:hypothetical protein
MAQVALLAFRSLDPFRALREPDRRRRDEERPSRSEQSPLHAKGARPNHVGAAISRHKRAGRIEERGGKLYATQSTFDVPLPRCP